MDLSKLRTPDWVIGVSGVLFIIDAFLPWASVHFPGVVLPNGSTFGGVTATSDGLGSPQGIWIILAFIIAIVMVGQIVLSRLTTVSVPDLGAVSWGQVHVVGGIAILVLSVLKLVAVRHYIGFGAWIGIVLGVALTVGGAQLARMPSEPAGGVGPVMPPSSPLA